jgi:hypothetical protein
MEPKRHRTLVDLPNELVRYTFQLAASTSRDTALSLSLVSSWTRDLVLPYLFATVVLKTATSVTHFVRYLSNPPNHRVATFIRNLWLPNPRWFGKESAYELGGLLRSCHRLINLAVGGLELWYADPDAFILPHFQIRGLRLFIHDWSDLHLHSSFRHPRHLRLHMYNLVTHIYVYDLFFLDPNGIGPHVATFPRLTHLAVASTEPAFLPPLEDFSSALKSPVLKVLVLVIKNRCPSNIGDIRALYEGLCEQSTDRLQVYVAFGGPLTVWGEDLRGWLDEVEGRSYNVWERAIMDTEEWNKDMD